MTYVIALVSMGAGDEFYSWKRICNRHRDVEPSFIIKSADLLDMLVLIIERACLECLVNN